MEANRLERKELVVEVYGFLRDVLKCPVTMEDLDKPTAMTLSTVYEAFLLKLTDRQGNLLPFAVLQAFHYPELHEVSASIVSWALSLDHILEDTSFEDGFFIKDLLQPNPAKTLRVLLHLIRFYRFREQRSHVVENMVARFNDSENERRRLELENEQLKERINAARVRLEEAQPHFKKMKEFEQQLGQELQEKRSKSKALSKQAGKMDVEEKNLIAILRKTEGERERLMEESQRLDSQIISSPDKMRNELKRLQSEKDELLKEMEEIQATLSQYNGRKGELARVDSLLSSITTPFEEILEEKEKLDALHEGFRRMMEQCNDLHMSVQGTVVKNVGKRKMLESREGQLKTVDEQLNSRLDEVKKQIEELKRALDAAAKKRRRDDLESVELDKQCEMARHQLVELHDQLSNCKEELVKKFRYLEDALIPQLIQTRDYLRSVNEHIRKDMKK